MAKLLTRRKLLGGGIVVVGAGAFGAYRYDQWAASVSAEEGTTLMTPPDALAAVAAGELTLVDVRRPDEWAETGTAPGAQLLDMRRDDFEDEVIALVKAYPDRPIAFICARGVRSRRVVNAIKTLENAELVRIVDVPEGMLGSRAGPGWVERGLPTDPYSG